MFGTVSMVREELGRYFERSPADPSLVRQLSHLRSTDQSWCILTSAVYRQEPVRRTLAALDPVFVQPLDSADVGLIMGIHFGKQVEIEYEIVSDSGISEESQPVTQRGFSWAPRSDTTFHKVIRLSQKQYDNFIAMHENRGLTRAGPGRSVPSSE